MTPEHERINSRDPAWRRWGPYLSERAWGTVREDYSADGQAWGYLPHDHARSKAYRWNEDGLTGICDDHQRLCFAPVFWNGRDPILKERLFGLDGREGNHGEDVKEYYYYLDSTPTHSYMRALYKYPQRAFPYTDLIETSRRRSRADPEYELIDTGVFAEDRYFDIFVEYAKASPRDVLIRLNVINRGPDPADLHVLPTLWFRNVWSWGQTDNGNPKPILRRANAGEGVAGSIVAQHATLGRYVLACDSLAGEPAFLFTENDTNVERLYGAPNPSPYVKDGFHEAIVQGRRDAIIPDPVGDGTKAAAHYRLSIAAGGTATVRLRLTSLREQAAAPQTTLPFADFDALFAQRQSEADQFYTALQPAGLSDDERLVQRQAFAGMLWSKQFYHYDVGVWLRGDPAQPPPPPERRDGRNHQWTHVNAADIISMPDKWEYPWFAAWDLAFHCLPLALVDPDFAKEQLVLLGREWFQHPNGQMPAYEWNFGDVNPPVLAWAAWRVYKIEQKARGQGDRQFLERMYHKLLLYFTWWVNRKDSEGNNVFQGGFLGLDNIGVFDRSAPLPTGGHLEQSDGTSWMAMFCLNMLTIALELATENRVYEDIATKFFEHFLYIAEAMNNISGDGIALWDEQDEFFYDVLHVREEDNRSLRIRSMVGLIPLFAVTTIEPALLEKLPEFGKRLEWFLDHRPELAKLVSRWHEPRMGDRRLLAILRGHRMKRVLRRMLDPDEFLSAYGVRALSRYHQGHPFEVDVDGARYAVEYLPAESNLPLFGGNSNWRGPIWCPVNYLIIESLQQFHHYYGDDFKVECPTGSGQLLTLNEIADFLSQRLIHLFVRDEHGQRAIFGGQSKFQSDPHWRDYLLFYEYFHGDNGAGLGASHQTGWTGLIAKLLQQQGERQSRPREA
ncbi:MAG: glucosidase [Chloroflexi bacterium]|nr:glucosidase [Chloroflexota bacterium]